MKELLLKTKEKYAGVRGIIVAARAEYQAELEKSKAANVGKYALIPWESGVESCNRQLWIVDQVLLDLERLLNAAK